MLRLISKSKNKKGEPIKAQIILGNKGKYTTKHVICKDKKKGIFMDNHGIPFIIN